MSAGGAGRPLPVLRTCGWILRLAGSLAPDARRVEWRREWEAELWHAAAGMRRSGRAGPVAQAGLACRCLGAFADAAAVRRLDRSRRPAARRGEITNSRPEVIMRVLAVLNVLVGIALGVGSVAEARYGPTPYFVVCGVVGTLVALGVAGAGIAALSGAPSAVRWMRAAAVASILFTILAARLMGGLAILVGAVYPVVVLLVLYRVRRDPPLQAGG